MTMHACIARVACTSLSLCLLLSCSGGTFQQRYEQLKDAMLLEAWDLSSVQHSEIMLWYAESAGPRLIYGTRIDNEGRGALYMRWNVTTDKLEVFHVSDGRDASANVPYRLKGMIRKRGPIQTTGVPHVIASGAAGEGLIYCKVTAIPADDR